MAVELFEQLSVFDFCSLFFFFLFSRSPFLDGEVINLERTILILRKSRDRPRRGEMAAVED